ncbi:DUF3313 domain-containing protein [Aquabacter spiritensis]|uniref:Uncharacterized protein DUF3313 n=1 Tax=Aquabacter spiritensis TaxID=933073 RepID=A0A4R3LVS1_9HYPH|nr:DUF3313 domain-containing protein [Aquabacter spiritensis]TCT04664.1 uncharacterized protein DUF3313 [Aquabacter spiritensis]
MVTARNRLAGLLPILILPLLVAGCATAPLDEGGSLTSYGDLAQADGILTKSKLRIDKDAVLAAKTVRIVPTAFAAPARLTSITEEQRRLVSNAVDRSLCAGLSERFAVVSPAEPADLTVHAVITNMAPTDETAVAATKIASVAKSILLPGVPVPTPRLPIGLGSLSMEAEARGPGGRPEAAMVWGRGANMLSGSARVSRSGDAYELAGAFGEDFSKLLVTGENPFKSLSGPPSPERFQSWAGGAPKHAACEVFGREPGIAGLVSGAVGMPQEWTDKGGGSTSSAPETAGPNAR